MKTADITTIKNISKSLVSIFKSQVYAGQCEKFYLNTPIEWMYYTRLSIKIIPKEIIYKYDVMGYQVYFKSIRACISFHNLGFLLIHLSRQLKIHMASARLN